LWISLLLPLLIPLALCIVYYVFNGHLTQMDITMLFGVCLYMAARYVGIRCEKYVERNMGAMREARENVTVGRMPGDFRQRGIE
jgi:hypothetical protein